MPVKLKCEYLVNPLGVDAARPRLSWEVAGSVEQGAYQVVVASRPEWLEGGKADLWNSGKVLSDASVHISYEGKALSSRQRVFWAVRYWTESGEVSGFSEPGYFEMGLLQPSDWKAKWIAQTEEVDYRPAPFFRKVVSFNKSIVRGRIYVTGLGYYDLYLNGQKVGDHVLDPAFTRYDRRILYVAYDVTNYLRQGQNAVGLVLGTGWLNIHSRAVWNFDQAPWRCSPRLLLEMHVEFEDGSSRVVASDETWKTASGPITYDSIYCGEAYDARLEKRGWSTAKFTDTDWTAAKVVRPPGGELVSQMMPPIRVVQSLNAQAVTEPQPGIYVYDFGQNFAGVPHLMISEPAGTTIEMVCAERLTPEGLPDEQNGMYIKGKDPGQSFQTDTYIAAGTGAESWEPRFTYHGFRYVQARGFTGPARLENISARVVHTAVAPAGRFECSNLILNQVWKNTCWSHVSNLHGYPTDCPHREKNGWTGDGHLAAEEGIFNFDMAGVYTKWLGDLRDEQQPNGELPGIVPTGGWGYPKDWTWIGPAWDSVLVLIPWYLYQYYGDLRILETNFEAMKRLINFFTSRAKGHIIAEGLGDWCPAKDETPVELTSTAMYYTDVLLLAKIAGLLGKSDLCEPYIRLADQIKQAMNEKLFEQATGLYAGGTQTAQSGALFHGLVEPANQRLVFEKLLEKIERDDFHINTGILGAKWVMQVLTDFGRADVAYRIASQTTFPGWGHWVAQGATTLWENWNGSNSHNHIMYGDIAAWFYKALGGIIVDPEKPGFRHFYLRPNPVGDLTHVKAEYRSIRGLIRSHWRREGGRFDLEVTVPGNSSATVVLPDGTRAAVGPGEHGFSCEG